MTQASYTAWDGESYEWPPPVGWYEASDQQWWPEGYGPPPPAAPEPIATPTADIPVQPVAEQQNPETAQSSHGSSGVHSDPYATMPPQSVVADPQSVAASPVAPDPSAPTVRDAELPEPPGDGGPTLERSGIAAAGVAGAGALGGLAASTDAAKGALGDVAGSADASKDALGVAGSNLFDANVDSMKRQIVPPPAAAPFDTRDSGRYDSPKFESPLSDEETGVFGQATEDQFSQPLDLDPPPAAPQHTGYAPTERMPPTGQMSSPAQMPPPVGDGFDGFDGAAQAPPAGQMSPPVQVPPPGQPNDQFRPGSAAGEFSSTTPQASFSPPQYTTHIPPGATPGNGTPQINAPMPQPAGQVSQAAPAGMSSNAPSTETNSGSILAPPAEKTKGFPKKLVGIVLGLLIIVGLAFAAFTIFIGGDDTVAQGPGSLVEPHAVDKGVDVFWPNPPEQTWHIEVTEPATTSTSQADGVLTRVSITNKLSPDSSSPLSELVFTAVTPDGEAISGECPFTDGMIDLSNASVDAGGQIEGDLCWIVPGGSVDVLLGIESTEVGGRVHMEMN